MRYIGKDDMASVLVVDDDQDGREILAKFMRKAGLVVHTAPNGREALKILLDRTPRVVVLDVMMPEMNGVELMQVMRAYLRWSSLPVVILTAYPTGPHIVRARELGMACMYEKTKFLLSDLLDCVQKLIADPSASCAG